MAKTKVKQDIHSLYVRAGGYVFRPVENNYNSSGANPNYRRDGTSAFTVGQEVAARHRGGTASGTVQANGVDELWFSHGCYYGTGIKVEDCWVPT